MKEKNVDILRQIVRGRYARAAGEAGCGCQTERASGCCGSSQDNADSMNQIMGYSEQELGSVVEGANLGLGCGNPTAIGVL